MSKDSWIPNARDRLAQRRAEKPATRAGQIWALWPEIKACFDSGQSLKTVRQWLEDDADLVLTDRAFAVYVSRCRRKEATQRKAAAAEAFLRVPEQRMLSPQEGESVQKGRRSAPIPIARESDAPAEEAANADPVARRLQSLRSRRFDIREAHQNGDPTNVKLI